MYGVNSIRFGGIASGLDTEGIIKKLMNLEQTKLDRYNQQKKQLEWKRADYRTINNQLRSFREGANWNLTMQGTYMSKAATATNNNFFNVTATNKASLGSYNFEVLGLAEGVTVKGNPTQSVAEFFGGHGGEISFSFAGSADGEAKTVIINQNDTMEDIASKINAFSEDTGIKAGYDSGTNSFFIFTENTGADAQIRITEDPNGFLGKVLGLKDSNGDQLGSILLQDEMKVLGQGKNAQIKFNGVNLEFASNKFEFLGMEFDLKKVSNGEAVNVQVANNVDKIVDEIKAFVEAFNKIVDDLGNKTSEKKYREYMPLTDEMKADMKEKDIEAYEEKARSGLFRGDMMLNNIASEMRMTVTGAVAGLEGKFKTLSSIGITTSKDWKDNGKLYIDEDKLRAALAEDLDGVAKIFNNESEDPKSQGIAQKLDGQIKGFFERIATTAGKTTDIVDESYLGKEISGMEERIDTMLLRMQMLEQKYWNQFTAMEKALQQMQAQGDWFAAQMGGGQK